MNNKFLKIIAIIFFGLALVAALPWMAEKLRGGKTENTNNISVNLSGFTKETVTGIAIKKGGDKKVFSSKDGEWFIGSDEADGDKVDQLFQDLADLKIKNMVSQNEANHGGFDLAKDSGYYQLTLVQNGKENNFFIGKDDPSAGGFYMRKDGIQNVYLVSGSLRDKLTWDESKWKKANQ